MQYLIREFTDDRSCACKCKAPRENERMTLVEAESEKEAKEKVEVKGLLNCIKPPKTNWRWLEDEYKN